MLDVSERHLSIIKEILFRMVPTCEVRAFGSRINDTAHAGSDLDLCIVDNGPIGWQTMAGLRGAFEESNLPFCVDLLDWHMIPDNFKAVIEKQYTVLQ